MKDKTIESILSNKLIAIIRGYDSDTCLKIAESLHNGGINLIEVTFNQSAQQTHVETASAIKAINDHFGGQVIAGAGTVSNLEQLNLASAAGAKYIISPDTNISVIKKTCDLGLVSMPGAFTPTEIMSAYANGADFVKLFPAASLGEDYIKAILAPINHVPLMAVGGINQKNVKQFLDLGFKGIGIGGCLTNKEWISTGEFEKITALAKQFVENTV